MSLTNGEFFTGTTQTPPGGLPNHSESGLAEILQTTCGARRTGQITFRSDGSHGYVFLQQGQVVHAICGTVEGDEAIYQMLAWAPGLYVLDEDILPHKRTITLTWEQLLFEGARRADGGEVAANAEPVTTANPTTAMRAKDSQPKLIISLGDEQPSTVELLHEYTYLGRSEENELAIPEASISSRHCVFILSGADVIVRDLNSSNGTYVNGEPVPEAILRPGDNIQVGVIDIKFVPGVRRPKLSPATPAAKARQRTVAADAGTTLKLPDSYQRNREPLTIIDDSQKDKAFVSGSSPISYDQLAPDAPKPALKSSYGRIVILVVLIIMVIVGTAAYFVFLRR